ncbi:MAG: hypothetical protein HOO67_05640 [Candidatus Peribacteraceae bacterium]|nr:hypothetical protein [Candidatus Peribacteraceae bacterium]
MKKLVCSLILSALVTISCTNQRLSEKEIPIVPQNWEYVHCYTEVNAFKDCDFSLPLPEGYFFDSESADSGYFWIAGLGVQFRVLDSTDHDVDFEKLIRCSWLNPNDAKKCPEPDYVLQKNGYQVARRSMDGTYNFFIRTPKMTMQVIDPSNGGSFGPSITEENLPILETSVLNIRVDIK